MNKRIVVDPVTRIEGHLRIEADTDEAGAIKAAYSSGTMVRGIEIILQGRDPREAWAFAQRICGVCTLVHGVASVRSVENALDYRHPGQRQPDPQPDDRRAIRAGPRDALLPSARARLGRRRLRAQGRSGGDRRRWRKSISPYAKSSPGYFADVQKRLKTFVDSGQLGIFANGYWGHPGVQAAARGQPDGGGALSRGARLAARRRPAAHDLRRQEPAPELPGRRRAGADLGEPDRRRERRSARPRSTSSRSSEARRSSQTMQRLRRRGLCARHARHRRLLQGLVRARRRPRQFHDLRRVPADGNVRTRARCCSRAASSSTATCRTSSRSTSTIRRRCRSSSPTPGTITRPARTRACTPMTARPRSTTPVRSRPTTSSTSSKSYSWLKAPRWRGQGDGGRPAGARADALRAAATSRRKELAGYRAEEARPAARRRCSRRSAARRRAARDQDHRRPDGAAGSTRWSPTSRPATSQVHNDGEVGAVDLAERGAGASASWRRRAARSRTGS